MNLAILKVVEKFASGEEILEIGDGVFVVVSEVSLEIVADDGEKRKD